MDHETLVNAFQQIVQILRQQKGHVALFLLNALETEHINIIVSAQGYDQLTMKVALDDFMSLLESRLEKDILRSILRVTILKTSDPFVKAVNQTFAVIHAPQYLHSCTVSGIYIERGILLESQPYVIIPQTSPVKRTPGRKRGKAAISMP